MSRRDVVLAQSDDQVIYCPHACGAVYLRGHGPRTHDCWRVDSPVLVETGSPEDVS